MKVGSDLPHNLARNLTLTVPKPQKQRVFAKCVDEPWYPS